MKLLQFICVKSPLKFIIPDKSSPNSALKSLRLPTKFHLHIFSSSLVFLITPLLITPASAHGPGHQHTHQSTTPALIGNEDRHDGTKSKVVVEHLDERIWGASLMSGWESRHVHYGVNESHDSSVLFSEATARIYDLYLGAWAGFALEGEFQEWDFTASYRLELGPVFFLPGYNFRLHLDSDTRDHIDHHDDDHDHHAHSEHNMTDHELHGHVHNPYNHELFVVVGTTLIPYVTPSVNFLWDLAQNSGGFVEARLDGHIPIYKNIFALRPYTLLGVNLGYNTWNRLGLNNYQLGIQATLNLTRHIALFGGVNYSVALPALRAIDQGNVVWADTGILVSF